MQLTIKHQNQIFNSWEIPALLNAGVPQSKIDAEIATLWKAKVSAECRSRIYAAASSETQMNMAAASAVISSKIASERSEQEIAVLEGLEAAISWVTNMRSTISVFMEDPSLDLAENENWPAIPLNAAAVLKQF